MSADELRAIYYRAWDLYYSPEHVATMMRRARAWGSKPKRILKKALAFYACIKLERKHPLEGGLLRRKYRRDRRPGLPLENPLVFYPRYFGGTLINYGRLLSMIWQFRGILKQVEQETQVSVDTDIAMQPVHDDEMEHLDMFTVTEAARGAANKARRQQAARDSVAEV